MAPFRALSTLTVGLWLGASILADVAVTQNFQAVDRFVAGAGAERTAERALLRRNAAEENAWIFINWERAELLLGAGLVGLLLAGERQRSLLPALGLAMLAIVAGEHFFLTDAINELGRTIDNLPAADPTVTHFWILHGLYSGLDLLKMALGFTLAVLLVRHRPPASGAALSSSDAAASRVLTRG